ncbi:hypothetical protein SAMN04488056_1305 [Cohaesibacter marisflavi]|uniref:Uncharacterized protein n=1 Tax=Cohaesibacter marisflavi TaxID=655353 RepID=A0A1I5NF54_9HYPH|nr:hypothetical protein SAMN04488056_1305 [Cohaesibacter marisflavi]
MAVLAGIIGDVLVATLGTACHMPAKRLRSAGFYCRHHLELVKAYMSLVGLSPGRAVSTENIGYLQLWPIYSIRTLLFFSSEGFLLQQPDLFVGADCTLDGLGCHLRIACCR